ncbi:poly [ADP-ribose] polymerase-like [Drosophila rhopaloa]|uniref:PARP-type domain-containing protein n=1 Tax=Drosophila rhopaloa TaxID=1041015 RepID=A0ABM5J666_DRORH|nr:poly [ADP-ribose] polymerase-like [Drosophila rhopaloa]
MDIELPYVVEYAKSGRASCKGCKCSIPKNSLRIAVMVQLSSIYFMIGYYVNLLTASNNIVLQWKIPLMRIDSKT